MGNRQVVERYFQAFVDNDFDALDALSHEDYQAVYPQSGEVVRGAANRRAILESYPGGSLDTRVDLVVGRDDEFVTGPSWNIIHLTGSGDDFTVTGTILYPDGQTWHVVSLVTTRAGKIWRQVDYFAQPFDPPAWRSDFVEIDPSVRAAANAARVDRS